jgi:hypothetical protein
MVSQSPHTFDIKSKNKEDFLTLELVPNPCRQRNLIFGEGRCIVNVIYFLRPFMNLSRLDGMLSKPAQATFGLLGTRVDVKIGKRFPPRNVVVFRISAPPRVQTLIPREGI